MTKENIAEELAATTTEALAIKKEIQSTEIQSTEQYQLAASVAKDLKGRLDALEERRTAITKPMNDALKSVNDLFRAPRQYLEGALGDLRQKLTQFQLREQEKERAALKAAIQTNNSHELVALAIRSAPVAEGVSFRDDYEVAVEDLAAVPREWFNLDLARVKAAVKASKGQLQIPGIKVTKTKIAAITGNR